MEEFEFYQDVKVTVWCRQHFSVEAESKEEALKLVEKYKTEDVSDHEDIIDNEWLFDTWEAMSVEENGGDSTIELYDRESNEMIGSN